MIDFPFEIIVNWYKKHGRHDLPWRVQQDPYSVWISEIFLQQTQVSRVREYFLSVKKAFPSVGDIAQTDYETFFPYYKGLGYYSRARNMLKTAHIVHTQYHGTFPSDYKELISLPGVGPYTAQAILAFGFGENIISWDTNIEKIFSRFYKGSRFIKLTKSEKEIIQKQFETTGISGRDINAALMDYSSLLDLNNPQSIDFDNYLLGESVFYKTGASLEHRQVKEKSQFSSSSANIVVFLHENHKLYFSKNLDEYDPFFLGKTEKNHRHFVQEYFSKNFGLEISVRPAFEKFEQAGQVYFYFHAQIQTGAVDFAQYSKKERASWTLTS